MKLRERDMSDTDYSTVKAMVIDDEAFARKFVTRLLEAIGIGQVYTAVSGADALAQLVKEAAHSQE